MANECDTKYCVVGDKDEVSKLYSILQTIQKKNDEEEIGFDDVVEAHGADFDTTDVDCRYSIEHIEMSDGLLRMTAVTAWNENPGFIQFIESFYKGVKVYYLATEPGDLYFVTNDTDGEYFSERYIIDYCGDVHTYDTLGELAEDVGECVGHDVPPFFTSIKSELERWRDEDGGEYYFLCRYDGFDYSNEDCEGGVSPLF